MCWEKNRSSKFSVQKAYVGSNWGDHVGPKVGAGAGYLGRATWGGLPGAEMDYPGPSESWWPGSPSPGLVNLVLWWSGFRRAPNSVTGINGFNSGTVLTVPSPPLHFNFFNFNLFFIFVTKSFKADWPHSDIFGMSFFFFFAPVK